MVERASAQQQQQQWRTTPIEQSTRYLVVTEMATTPNNFGLRRIVVVNEDRTQWYEGGLIPDWSRYVGEKLAAYSEEPYTQTLMRHGCTWVQPLAEPPVSNVGPVVGNVNGLIEFNTRAAATAIREEADRETMLHMDAAMQAVTPMLNPQPHADVVKAWMSDESHEACVPINIPTFSTTPVARRQLNQAFLDAMARTPIDPEVIAAVSNFTRMKIRQGEERAEASRQWIEQADKAIQKLNEMKDNPQSLAERVAEWSRENPDHTEE